MKIWVISALLPLIAQAASPNGSECIFNSDCTSGQCGGGNALIKTCTDPQVVTPPPPPPAALKENGAQCTSNNECQSGLCDGLNPAIKTCTSLTAAPTPVPSPTSVPTQPSTPAPVPPFASQTLPSVIPPIPSNICNLQCSVGSICRVVSGAPKCVSVTSSANKSTNLSSLFAIALVICALFFSQ